jgi:hypothetical protein
VVPLSVEAAFDAYVDASHFHEWQRMLKRVLDLQGSTSVPGSTYVLDHGIVGKMRVDVLTVERPGLYRIRQQGLGLDVISTTRFIQVRDDRTQVHLTMDLTVGRLQRLLRLPAGLGRWSIEDELTQFKKWVIRTHRPGGATNQVG